MNTCTFRNVKKLSKFIFFFKNLHIKKTLFNNLINSDKSIFYFLKINDISRYFLFLHNSVVHCIKLYMYIMNLSRGLMINVICIATHCIVWLSCHPEAERYSEYVREKLGDILSSAVADVAAARPEDPIDFLAHRLYTTRVST